MIRFSVYYRCNGGFSIVDHFSEANKLIEHSTSSIGEQFVDVDKLIKCGKSDIGEQFVEVNKLIKHGKSDRWQIINDRFSYYAYYSIVQNIAKFGSKTIHL